MKLLSIVFAATFLLFPSAARAGSAELVAYVRGLIFAAELPPIADDADIELAIDGKPMRLTAKNLREMSIAQKRMMTYYEIRDFKVERAECNENRCTIRYNYAMSMRINGQDISGNCTSDEDYRQSGDKFILIRARQVQHTERQS